jgi:N-acetyl-gamma-glutamyl-phosphate reductase
VVLATPHGPALELGARCTTPAPRSSTCRPRSGSAPTASPPGTARTPRPDLAAGDDAPPRTSPTACPSSHRDGSRARRWSPTPAATRPRPCSAWRRWPTCSSPGTIVVDAKSGTSGAGRAAKDHLHFATSTATWPPTAPRAPPHRRDRAVAARRARRRQLHPAPGADEPGLLATCYATLRDGVGPTTSRTRCTTPTTTSPSCTCCPGTFPHTKALAGSNGCQLSAVVDERTGRVVVTSRSTTSARAPPGRRCRTRTSARRGRDHRADRDRGVPVIAGLGPRGPHRARPRSRAGSPPCRASGPAGSSAASRPSGKPDLALVVADEPAPRAVVTTTNLVKAPACVAHRAARRRRHGPRRGDQRRQRQRLHPDGEAHTPLAAAAARPPRRRGRADVLVMSTGVIGVPLPIERIDRRRCRRGRRPRRPGRRRRRRRGDHHHRHP